jgi:hypothetical protein
MEMTKRWNGRFREIIGFQVKPQCPSRAMICHLAELIRERGGSLRRVDVSYEFRSDELSFDEQTRWIRQHLRLRRRRSGLLGSDYDTSVYFVPNSDLERSIDVTVYWDRASKLDDSTIVNKFELRVRGADRISEVLSVECAEELLRLNPARIFFSRFDVSQTFDSLAIDPAVEKAISDAIDKARQMVDARRKPLMRDAAFLKSVPTLLERIWGPKRKDLAWVQRVHDIFPQFLHPSATTVSVSERLSWRAKARLA